MENAAANPNNVQYHLDSSFSYNSVASVSTDSESFDGALENCQKAFAIQEKVAAADAKSAFAQTALARTYRRMGDILQALEKFDEAAVNHQKSIKMFEEFSQLEPDNTDKKARLADVYTVFGSFLLNPANSDKSGGGGRVRLDEARTFQNRGLEIFQTLKSQNALDKVDEEKLTALQERLRQTETKLAGLLTKQSDQSQLNIRGY